METQPGGENVPIEAFDQYDETGSIMVAYSVMVIEKAESLVVMEASQASSWSPTFIRKVPTALICY